MILVFLGCSWGVSDPGVFTCPETAPLLAGPLFHNHPDHRWTHASCVFCRSSTSLSASSLPSSSSSNASFT